ncbi:hypothetical protein SDRG_14486 [Saprolegnia diclina VS20]|uniref:PH domain-containing protein n=1 Tax=Saprolegnia diclina (strain VS20) TaxID=1156394 RepID=T0PZQ5_SAPDV|nr:hypothetical protein SDRG_14486 [Saprolegnia diclina VS20]EQC27736.1 hypothetical protein SDRG_14486 [Saprolegnia diclina VS20]|eukprot:XP_008618841.1 hypothetical protein SDRG_14486 [Saprolegnia diclina VS20]
MAAYDYQGWVFKQGSLVRSWKKRYMVLKNKQLSYFDTENVTASTKAKGSFAVITIEYAKDIQHGLLIHGVGGRVMKLYTESAESCTGWFDAVTAVMLGQVLSQASLRASSHSASAPRTSSLRASTNQPYVDDDNEHCSGWLAKEGGRVKNWKRRFFFLQGRSLTYYDNDKMAGSAKGNGQVCGVRVNREKAQSLDITFEKGRILRVTADCADEFDTWFQALTAAVEGRAFRRDRGSMADSRPSIASGKPPVFSSMDSYASYEDGGFSPGGTSSRYLTQDSLDHPLGRNNNSSWLSSDSDDDKSDGDWL